MASRPLAPDFTRIPRRSGGSYSRRRDRARLMLMLYRIVAWPLVVKVPVLVAGLMITVAYAMSQVVLWRSVQDQERNDFPPSCARPTFSVCSAEFRVVRAETKLQRIVSEPMLVGSWLLLD